MILKAPQISSSCHTRVFTLAALLLWLFAVSVRELSAQGTAINLSGSDIEDIVSIHNVLRGMVDPPASNIQALVSPLLAIV